MTTEIKISEKERKDTTITIGVRQIEVEAAEPPTAKTKSPKTKAVALRRKAKATSILRQELPTTSTDSTESSLITSGINFDDNDLSCTIYSGLGPPSPLLFEEDEYREEDETTLIGDRPSVEFESIADDIDISTGIGDTIFNASGIRSSGSGSTSAHSRRRRRG